MDIDLNGNTEKSSTKASTSTATTENESSNINSNPIHPQVNSFQLNSNSNSIKTLINFDDALVVKSEENSNKKARTDQSLDISMKDVDSSSGDIRKSGLLGNSTLLNKDQISTTFSSSSTNANIISTNETTNISINNNNENSQSAPQEESTPMEISEENNKSSTLSESSSSISSLNSNQEQQSLVYSFGQNELGQLGTSIGDLDSTNIPRPIISLGQSVRSFFFFQKEKLFSI